MSEFSTTMPRAGGRYVIIDEPQPGRLASMAVSPSWPLLGMMLGGSWLGLPWFLFNSIAMGSPNLKREVATMIATVSGVLTVAIGAKLILESTGHAHLAEYLLYVALPALKLGGGYWLTQLQSGPYKLHLKVGGKPRSAATLALASYFLRATVLGAAAAISPWLAWVVA
jgi:hypothetical protein